MIYFGKIEVELANLYQVTSLHCYFHKQRKNFCWRYRREFLASEKNLFDTHWFSAYFQHISLLSWCNILNLWVIHLTIKAFFTYTYLLSLFQIPFFQTWCNFSLDDLVQKRQDFFYKKMDPVLKYNLGGIRLQTITIRFQSQLPLLLCTAPLANLHTLLKQNISKIFSAYFWNIPFALHQMQISTLSNIF